LGEALSVNAKTGDRSKNKARPSKRLDRRKIRKIRLKVFGDQKNCDSLPAEPKVPLRAFRSKGEGLAT